MLRSSFGLITLQSVQMSFAVRQARLRQIQMALEQEPIEFQQMFEIAQGLFKDEDRLVDSLFGATQRLRITQLEKRTAILGILGSIAGLPWEESIGW